MRAAIIAFSMYSRIPMPMFEWKEEDMKYAMCFFSRDRGSDRSGVFWNVSAA